eukprot:TRINITY_DN108780_c0_g1_i1.p1 TRINITY_DN108780_c0_g1~~TRINITY_DN108780_c0_g1_i1.p1  ORF type:complete len:239 (-),score=65.09 TRINITY_DN108780_c0_g1_i1:29-646(-)
MDLFFEDRDLFEEPQLPPAQAPTVISEKMLEKLLKHQKMECKPCAYFHGKTDGCRQGDDCVFCHFCDKDAMKQRKRMKKEMFRQANALKKAAAVAPQVKSDDETTQEPDGSQSQAGSDSVVTAPNTGTLKTVLQKFSLPVPEPAPLAPCIMPPPGLAPPGLYDAPYAAQTWQPSLWAPGCNNFQLRWRGAMDSRVRQGIPEGMLA